MQEGVIKFRCEWIRELLSLPPELVASFRRWHARLSGEGLVGALPDGVGFGNLSVRAEIREGQVAARGWPPGAPPSSFLITGSGTGGAPQIGPDHLTLVTDHHIEANHLTCRGPIRASSESLSHAALYRARPDAGAVIHIHSRVLWERTRAVLPTTDPTFRYGTPELALALEAIARGIRPGALQCLVMGGHPEGLMVFARDLDAAGESVLLLRNARP